MRASWRLTLIRGLILLGFIGLLEVLCAYGIIDTLTMQPPHRILTDLVRLLASGAFNRAIARTLSNAMIATTMAIIVGVTAATLIHRVRGLREALDFALSYSPDVALEMVATLHWYGDARGVLNEHRHWIERALTATPSEPTPDRIRALHAIAVIAGGQGDMPTAGARAAEAVQLAEQVADPVARGPRMDRRHEEPTPSRRGADCGRGETRSPDGSFARRTARFGCLSTRMRTAHARRPWC